MRLHRLRMTAIGPFRDRTELDLADFGGTGLFLIEGATGAGKSTILDAISFALYGRLAQSGASIERLKSHHAPLGTEPVVELVFETQRGRYRIRRTAPYDRPKKRGAGTLPVRMTVALYRLTDPEDLDRGELISNNLGDAEDEITRAVGLTHGQFVQTVLLPQGEFANFLTAKTDVKRDLLQKLFGTELLERTQAKLVEGRQQAEKLRKSAVESVRAAVNAFAGVTELADVTVTELVAAAEHGAVEALTAAVAAEQANLARAVDVARADVQVAEADRIRADQNWQVATELQQRRTLRSQLRARRQQLSELAGDHSQAAAELSAAERALQVAGAADAVHSARTELSAAQQHEAKARAQLPAGLAGLDEPQLRRTASAHAGTLGQLQAELIRERELSGRRRDLLLLEADHAERRTLVTQAESRLAELPDRRHALDAERAAAELASARLPELLAHRDRAAARLRAAEQAELAASEAEQERLVAQELLDAAQREDERVRVLRQRWQASIASELGLALQDGNPCTVCGSVEHPRPARPAVDHVSQAQLQRAEDGLRVLQSDVQLRTAQVQERQAEVDRLQLAADKLTPELAAATLAKAEVALSDTAESADRLDSLAADLEQLDAEWSALNQALTEARTAQTRLVEQLAALSAAITRDEQSLQAARGEYPSVADRVAALATEIELLETTADAASRTRNLATAAATAAEIFQAALAEARFAHEADWREAVRTGRELEQLREQVRQYEEQVAATEARLSADDLIDPALDEEPADLSALGREVERARSAEKAMAEQHGAVVNRLTAAQRLGSRVEAALHQSEAVLASTAPAIRIGNLVAGLGENRLKMELTTYVLVRRFADVLAASNTELQRISQGRYQLEHTDARTGSAKSGLNLRVLDLHTGQPRDPATLSGGETFYVSLALALGLADVVRAESGGIDLGTLFIDEGFGTLDAEVLDEVIDVLDGLRDGGRAVGIVSHVSELKMRIADRIKVERQIDGTSRLLTTV